MPAPAAPTDCQQTIDRLAHSPAEAARLLGVSRSKLYTMLDAGELHSVHLGRRRLVPHSELLRVLEVSGR